MLSSHSGHLHSAAAKLQSNKILSLQRTGLTCYRARKYSNAHKVFSTCWMKMLLEAPGQAFKGIFQIQSISKTHSALSLEIRLLTMNRCNLAICIVRHLTRYRTGVHAPKFRRGKAAQSCSGARTSLCTCKASRPVRPDVRACTISHEVELILQAGSRGGRGCSVMRSGAGLLCSCVRGHVRSG